jgi:hypothetical protein
MYKKFYLLFSISAIILLGQMVFASNSVLDLNLEFDYNSNARVITIYSRCVDAVSNASITIFEGSFGTKQLSGVSCVPSGARLDYNDLNLPIDKTLMVSLSISPPCTICNKSVFIYTPVKQTPSAIPDNNILLVVLIVGICLVILRKKTQ